MSKNTNNKTPYSKELDRLQAQELYRVRHVVDGMRTFPISVIDGKQVVNFGSNNYLGIGKYIQDKVLALCTEYGIVQQASPLVTGYTQWHKELEQKVAAMKGSEAGLVLSSGFQANLTALSALLKTTDLMIVDKMSHASIMEVTRYRHINYRAYPHMNYEYLEKILKNNRHKFDNIFIITDSLFSMTGDLADLQRCTELSEKYDCWLVIDDAHATGTYGNKGSGLAVNKGHLDGSKIIITGSFSKALQSYGGYIVGPSKLMDYLVNIARPYIYNTALPLVHVFAALEAIRVLHEGTHQEKLWRNIHLLIDALKVRYPVEYSPIVPVIIGDNKKTMDLSQYLFEEGYYCPAIRYPTVPRKKAMLRISVSAAHSKSHISGLASILA